MGLPRLPFRENRLWKRKNETRRQAGKTVKNIMIAVMQKPESEWEVVAFHYGPV